MYLISYHFEVQFVHSDFVILYKKFDYDTDRVKFMGFYLCFFLCENRWGADM